MTTLELQKLSKHLLNVAEELKTPLLHHLKQMIKFVAKEGAEGFDKLTDIINAQISSSVPGSKPTVDLIENIVDGTMFNAVEILEKASLGLIDNLEKGSEINSDHA